MPPMKDHSEKGIVSQTRHLYNQLSGEARRLAQHDSQQASHRGPVAKALLAACLVAVLAAAVTMVYGFISFPDGPIRETTRGYVGKHGEPHTRDDYEQYKLWEKLLVASFGMALVTGFGAVAAERKGQPSRGGERSKSG
jgi:hypothetical protein